MPNKDAGPRHLAALKQISPQEDWYPGLIWSHCKQETLHAEVKHYMAGTIKFRNEFYRTFNHIST